MLLLLSPSKTQDFITPPPIADYTLPRCLEQSAQLIKKLRNLSEVQIAALMDISPKLAKLNVERYADFTLPFTPSNAKQALLSFKGDVYTDIDVAHYTKEDFVFAQAHVRMLSGLYGLLRPLDLIQPYRLEMGVKLPVARKKDLYAFWGDRITALLNEELAAGQQDYVINLASKEYFSAVNPRKLIVPVITPVFKEAKQGEYKIVALYAKRARGTMTNFIIKHRIELPEHIKQFAENGYSFNSALSSSHEYVFTR
jgi:uncharacterized protein